MSSSRSSEHLPLYWQAQVFARHGSLSTARTLADRGGRASWHLAPVVDRMAAHLKRSGKLFMDETVAPVPDFRPRPDEDGLSFRRSRDDRGWVGATRRASCSPTPGRGGVHAEEILDGFDGILQVDAGHRRLADERAGAASRSSSPTAGPMRDAR